MFVYMYVTAATGHQPICSKQTYFTLLYLYYSYLNIGVDVLVSWPIGDEELHVLILYFTGSRPDVFETHVGGTH